MSDPGLKSPFARDPKIKAGLIPGYDLKTSCMLMSSFDDKPKPVLFFLCKICHLLLK